MKENIFPPEQVIGGKFYTASIPIHRFLQQILAQRIIPHLKKGIISAVSLADPIYLARREFSVMPHPGNPLHEKPDSHSHLILQEWPEQNIHASRHPCLVAVVEGSVDWRIGITRSVAEQLQGKWQNTDYLIREMSENTCFLVPPGTPYSNGKLSHYEKNRAARKKSLLFWIRAFPSGCFVHFCRSEGMNHDSCAPMLISCQQTYPLMRMLQAELEIEENPDPTIAWSLLLSLFSYVHRSLVQRISVRQIIGATEMYTERADENHQLRSSLQCALEYIEANLARSLKIDDIASRSFCSSRQLNRYFRQHLGMSIMDYVISRRIEAAKVLLNDTNLPISEIAHMVGYKAAPSFNQTFKKITNTTPLSYRGRNG